MLTQGDGTGASRTETSSELPGRETEALMDRLSIAMVGTRGVPARYGGFETAVEEVGRRLLVKPGLTGLWQISGRSDLPWEESVRLDLRYVENWSLAMDLLILAKTVRAVLSRSGAY